MALPKNSETARGIELREILEASGPAMEGWPMPTKEDYVVIGGIVVLYSYVEFQMRRLIDVFEHAGLLADEWKGKGGNLNFGEVERAVRATPVWAGPDDLGAFDKLAELRPLRNLVAHFVVRRFPDDDAFFFVAKSTKDFTKVFGRAPAAGEALTAIIEREQVVGALRTIMKRTLILGPSVKLEKGRSV
jgi:hypothetical protein